jgi:hypothetical protein
MNKIIGGLLVVSLLSRPAIFNVEYLAYQVLKAQSQIICVIKKSDEDETEDVKDINKILTDIDENSRCITSLLKEKRKLVDKIQTRMDLLAYTKTTLNEFQIISFAEFSAIYKNENMALHNTMTKIEDNKEITKVKKEFMKKESDTNFIYNQLKEIMNYQLEAMQTLRSIVLSATNTLAIL